MWPAFHEMLRGPGLVAPHRVTPRHSCLPAPGPLRHSAVGGATLAVSGTYGREGRTASRAPRRRGLQELRPGRLVEDGEKRLGGLQRGRGARLAMGRAVLRDRHQVVMLVSGGFVRHARRQVQVEDQAQGRLKTSLSSEILLVTRQTVVARSRPQVQGTRVPAHRIWSSKRVAELCRQCEVSRSDRTSVGRALLRRHRERSPVRASPDLLLATVAALAVAGRTPSLRPLGRGWKQALNR